MGYEFVIWYLVNGIRYMVFVIGYLASFNLASGIWNSLLGDRELEFYSPITLFPYYLVLYLPRKMVKEPFFCAFVPSVSVYSNTK